MQWSFLSCSRARKHSRPVAGLARTCLSARPLPFCFCALVIEMCCGRPLPHSNCGGGGACQAWRVSVDPTHPEPPFPTLPTPCLYAYPCLHRHLRRSTPIPTTTLFTSTATSQPPPSTGPSRHFFPPPTPPSSLPPLLSPPHPSPPHRPLHRHRLTPPPPHSMWLKTVALCSPVV